MPIVRLKNREKNFLVVDKECLNDPEVSLAAKGLYAYMMGLPSDWELNIDDLAARSRNGRDATRTAFNELVAKGYIEKKTIREKGKFQGVEYVAYETPNLKSFSPEEHIGPKSIANTRDVAGSNICESIAIGERESHTITPQAEQPFPGFPQLLSNEINKKNNIYISTPLDFTPTSETIDAALAKGLTSVLEQSEIERFLEWNIERNKKHTVSKWQEMFLKWLANTAAYNKTKESTTRRTVHANNHASKAKPPKFASLLEENAYYNEIERDNRPVIEPKTISFEELFDAA